MPLVLLVLDGRLDDAGERIAGVAGVGLMLLPIELLELPSFDSELDASLRLEPLNELDELLLLEPLNELDPVRLPLVVVVSVAVELVPGESDVLLTPQSLMHVRTDGSYWDSNCSSVQVPASPLSEVVVTDTPLVQRWMQAWAGGSKREMKVSTAGDVVVVVVLVVLEPLRLVESERLLLLELFDDAEPERLLLLPEVPLVDDGLVAELVLPGVVGFDEVLVPGCAKAAPAASATTDETMKTGASVRMRRTPFQKRGNKPLKYAIPMPGSEAR